MEPIVIKNDEFLNVLKAFSTETNVRVMLSDFMVANTKLGSKMWVKSK